MSDAFRAENLVAFMQQVVDGPTLPKLFMRTVRTTPPSLSVHLLTLLTSPPLHARR